MPKLTIELIPSKQLSILYLVLGGGAVLACWLLPFSWYWQAMLMFVPLLTIFWLLYKYAWLKHRQSIVKLESQQQNMWLLHTASGEQLFGKLLGDSFISPFIIVLTFKVANYFFTKSVIIMPDIINPQHLKRMRSYLKQLKG